MLSPTKRSQSTYIKAHLNNFKQTSQNNWGTQTQQNFLSLFFLNKISFFYFTVFKAEKNVSTNTNSRQLI